MSVSRLFLSGRTLNHDPKRTRHFASVLRKAQHRRVLLESLESRTLLAVLTSGDAVSVTSSSPPAETATLQGTVWNDADGNGEQGAGEPGLGAITVYLDKNENGQRDEGEPSTITNDFGDYAFSDLAPGRYVVRDLLGDDALRTSPGIQPGVYYGAAYVGTTGNVQVVQIDATSGDVIWLGNPLAVRMHGMIVTNDGQMYGINGFSSRNDELYHIDPATGQTTLIGATGLDLVWGLAYDAATDTIYSLANTGPGNTLIKLDRHSAHVSFVNREVTVALSGTSGLSFDPVGRQVIAYANGTKEFCGFATDGTVTKIGHTNGLDTWSLAHNGQELVTMGRNINDRSILITVDPLTGTWQQKLQLNQSLSLESLEWVGSAPHSHAVYVRPGETISGIDFGQQRLIADAGDDYQIAQGSALELTGSAAGAPSDAVSYQWDLNGDGAFDAEGAAPVLEWEDLVALGLGTGSHTIRLQVSDGTRVADDFATLVIDNAAPEISNLVVPGIGEATAGDEAVVVITFNDPGTPDQHTISIDWGNGVLEAIPVEPGNRTVSLSHRYTLGGVYTVQVSVQDELASSQSVSAPAFITGIGLHGGVVHVVGTAGGDRIDIARPRGKWLQVDAANIPGDGTAFQESDVESILVWLGDGDNSFSMHSALKTPVAVVGGSGNDYIQAGGGRNLLIGGAGSDRLIGGTNEDILIAGSTAFDHNAAALLAVLREWNSGRSYEERVQNLVSGSGTASRLNGGYYLTVGEEATVFDDDAEDSLSGANGRDWFFVGSLDGITDLAADEVIGNDLEEMLAPPPPSNGKGNGNGKKPK